MSSQPYQDAVREALRLLPGHLLVALLVGVSDELARRGDADAANFVTRAARAHAAWIASPDAPSDNGHGNPGDSEAGR